MQCYILAYDLHQEPESAYDNLIEALENAGAVRAQWSVWLLRSFHPAKAVYAAFSPFLHQGDELIVTEIVLKNSCVTVSSGSLQAFQTVIAVGNT